MRVSASFQESDYGDFSSSDRAPVIALNLGDYPSSEVADELDQRFEIAVVLARTALPGCTGRWGQRNREL